MDQAGNIYIPMGLAIGTFVSATNTTTATPIPASVFTINGNILTISTSQLKAYLTSKSALAPDTITFVSSGYTITFNAYI